MSAQPEVDATRAGTPPPAAEAPESPSLLDVVRDLHRDLRRTRFPLEIPGAADARAARERLLGQLTDHLLPRLEQLSSPAVVVAAGSTGAGKSTLVNSLLGAEVSPAGVLRPTTRRPVLVHHPADADLLATHPLRDVVDVVVHERVPRGLALLDAPDLDSVVASNRQTAERLLEAADLWLFVTTAARYGDALPWRVLEAATERRASVAMVLNRVPPEALTTVRGELLQRLRERGMDGVPLFVVPDAGPREGLLSAEAVGPVQRWLLTLAGPDRARAVIVRTLRGSLGALRMSVDRQAAAVQAQADAAAALRDEVAAALVEPTAAAEASVAGGAVAAGQVGATWADLASRTGPLSRAVGRSGRLRGTRRAARRREAALLGLVAQLRGAAADAVEAAAAGAETALVERLAAPGAPLGAPGLVAGWPSGDHLAARSRDAAAAAAAWVESADSAVAHLGVSGDAEGARRAAQAVGALGAHGLAGVALAAAAGVEPARDLLAVALADDATALADSLRDGLVAAARSAVAREGESLQEGLRVPDLAPDAASRLRRRLAALEGLT